MACPSWWTTRPLRGRDEGWRPPTLASSVIYELHVGTFTPEGTLDAAIGRLEYLRELGITHVELMPLAAAEGERGWGYDGVALYAPLEAYGGPDAVKRFVDAAHQRGLSVLIDVVYNHFGPSGNYTGKFGPYITDQHKTPWGGAVNFEDAGSAEVREFFIDNALMWLRDYHFDGLRIDAVHAFIDRSAIHFLEQLEEEVRTLGNHTGRHYAVIAESDLNDPRLVTAREAGGYGLDAQWSDDFHHALWVVLTGERTGYYQDFGSMADLATAIREAFVYQGQYSPHRKRNHGRSIGALPADRFLGFIQNHDQVGNRAQGERLSQIVDVGTREDRGGDGAAVAVCADAVCRGGVRGIHALPVLHRLSGQGAGAAGIGGAAERVCGIRLGAGRGAGSAGGRDVSAIEAAVGGGRRGRPCRDAGVVSPADCVAPRGDRV